MKILVVDDSSFFRNVFRAAFEEMGHEVQTATDGLAALELLKKHPIDLVTLDLEMPGMSGFEVCEQLRFLENESGIQTPRPVVFITANDTLENRERGFELGALDFISKKFKKEELIGKIRAAVAVAPLLTGMTALVVDDSAVARGLISRCLRGEGLQVIEAADATEAYAIAEARAEEIDLIVSDVVMPGMQGDEFCRHVRKIEPLKHVPLIFVTGLPEKHIILELFSAGGSDHLIKPFAKEELVARVRVHTEVRRLNRTLQKQVAELERLNKLKTDLMAITSHDLRSPISGILACTELLLTEPEVTEAQREYLGLITQSGNQLLKFIGDLLDLTKIESHTQSSELVPLSLVEVIELVLPPLRPLAAEKGIHCDFQNRCPAGPPVVQGDKNSLFRIINNLVSNALKFTPRGGRVTLALEPAGAEEVLLSVVDTGLGIAAKNIPLLFEKFSKASRKGTAGEKGTGLGLAIVKELVTQHHGRIDVTSEVGQGTTFRVYFPLAK